MKILYIFYLLVVLLILFLFYFLFSFYGLFPSPFSNSPLILTPFIDAGQSDKAKELSKVKLPNSDVVSYSGFFNVNPLLDSNMFFWFFPAVNNPENAPVILWLQGGPGWSSLFGLFNENGPFTVDSKNNLVSRNTSWTLTHNVIYIDNPVGTGFSFTKNEEGYSKNQTDVANNLYNALQQFFKMFKEYKTNEFFITGQSYAGKYVPAIAHKIHLENPTATTKINMKGIAIASSFSDPISMIDYGDFLYSVGLLDYESKLHFNKVENDSREAIRQERYLDAFNMMDVLIMDFMKNPPTFYDQQTGYDGYYNFLQSAEHRKMDYSAFVQQDSVRKAMHVGDTPYTAGSATTAAKHLYGDIFKSVKPWIEELLDATPSYKVLLFNGQLDIVVASVLSDKFIRTLNWKEASEFAEAPRNIWRVRDDIAGYFTTAGPLTQLVVRKAGHAAPGDQPEWVLDLINRFTSGKGFE